MSDKSIRLLLPTNSLLSGRNEYQAQIQSALQNRAFAKFRRYPEIEILTYSKYAPVSPPAGGLALNYDKITGCAKHSFD